MNDANGCHDDGNVGPGERDNDILPLRMLNEHAYGVYSTFTGNGDHVQFSVFLCELNDVELARLKGRLHETVNQRQDQIIILSLGPAESSLDCRLQCIGQAYVPPGRCLVV